MHSETHFPDRLEEMLAMQRRFQTQLNGYAVDDQTIEQRITNFKVSLLALEDELHEALNEMGWKEWASSRHFNYDRVREELVDAWHFFMNLMIHASMDAERLYAMYQKKHAVNLTRQADGYDGVSGKCPACKRDLKESPPVRGVCPCGQVLPDYAV